MAFPRRAAWLLAVLPAGLYGGWRLLREPPLPTSPAALEALRAGSAYVTSEGCAGCHESRSASWHRTFHRTMTQAASEAAVVAPFDGRVLGWLGVPTVPQRNAQGGFEIVTASPVDGQVTTFPVVMTVGSRRMQQYVTRIGDRHVRLPIAYSLEDRRWFHLSEAFFHPDGEPFHAPTAVWDLNCIFCHNVKARPGYSAEPTQAPTLGPPGRIDSSVAEMGIACEACHGPGGEHARRRRAPRARLGLAGGDGPDPTIVHPDHLDKVRSSQVCGHCHGQRLPAPGQDIRAILGSGDPYTAGEDLARYYRPVSRESRIGDQAFASRFWADGSPRLTAYEYQGLTRSPCFLRGEMTCLSCHAMHAGDPHGQLRPDRPGDALCTQCHTSFTGAQVAAHTHHAEGSAGSRCIGCHMPPEVYGILTWHPSHEIQSPDPRRSAAAGKPDACTLCHSGRSRRWAAEQTAAWWPGAATAGGAGTELPDAPEMVRALFAGDVVYRTLAAARLGEPSPDPGVAWAAVPLLAGLLLDAYPNVRRTTHDSLARLTGRLDLPLALSSPEERVAAANRLAAERIVPPGEARWPFLPDGRMDVERLTAWLRERVEVDVAIGE